MKPQNLLITTISGLFLIACSSNAIKNSGEANKTDSVPATEGKVISVQSAQSLEQGLKEADNKFYYKGVPISPIIIKQFIPWMSDVSPTTITMDLAAAAKSNQYSDTATGTVTRFSDANGESSISYEYIGRLQKGVDVVKVVGWGGGSGQFESLCFFSFKTQKGNGDSENPDRLLMTIERFVSLGDRAGAKITLSENKVIFDIAANGDNKARKEEIVF